MHVLAMLLKHACWYPCCTHVLNPTCACWVHVDMNMHGTCMLMFNFQHVYMHACMCALKIVHWSIATAGILLQIVFLKVWQLSHICFSLRNLNFDTLGLYSTCCIDINGTKRQSILCMYNDSPRWYDNILTYFGFKIHFICGADAVVMLSTTPNSNIGCMAMIAKCLQ